MLAEEYKAFLEQHRLNVNSLSEGVDLVVVKGHHLVVGTLLSKDRENLFMRDKEGLKVTINFSYWNQPLCLPKTDAVLAVINDVKDCFRTYAIFETIGHMNKASNIKSQLKLQAIISKLPADAMQELEKLAFKGGGIKQCAGMLALSGPSTPDKYTCEFLDGALEQ